MVEMVKVILFMSISLRQKEGGRGGEGGREGRDVARNFSKGVLAVILRLMMSHFAHCTPYATPPDACTCTAYTIYHIRHHIFIFACVCGALYGI